MPASAEAASLRVQALELRLGRFALSEVDLNCAQGEYHILLGPTGSGKTTLLRCILGLSRVDRGRVLLGDRDVTSEPPERRGIGYVPQHFALFPHLNVEQNIRFGIHAKRPSSREGDALLEELLALLRIDHLRRRDVRSLSGGERQKVAIARALGTRPRTLLMDEPFSSIDAGSRRELWFEIKHLISGLGITTLHITHNLEEAQVLGDSVTVLIEGRPVQRGAPDRILERPASESVARFLGFRNIFHGRDRRLDRGARVEGGAFPIVVSDPIPDGERVGLCVRQQDIKILREDLPLKESLERNVFKGSLTRLFMAPEFCTAWFRLEGGEGDCDLELRFPRYLAVRHGLEPGKPLSVAFWEPSIVVWREVVDSSPSPAD